MPKLLRKKKGPIDIVTGKGISIPIYSTPAFGQSSYTISYYVEKRRVRERAGTLDDARLQARAAIDRLSTGAALVTTLTPKQSLMLGEVVDMLRPSGLPLSQVVREYLEALKALDGKGTLADAVQVYLESHAAAALPDLTFQDVVVKFLERNELQDYSKEYKTDCRKHLAILAKSLGTVKLRNIRQTEIAAALRSATGKGSPRRFNNLRGTVSAMFSFAQREGWLPRDKKHEASLVETANDRNAGAISIYTPTELSIVLSRIAKDMLPWIALGGLAGLRTSEIHRIEWEMIRLSAKVIILPKSFTKTKRRRVIPICPALEGWLSSLVGKGRIYDCSLEHFEYRMRTAWSAITGKDGKLLVEKKANGLRHSYGSYRFALLQDENRVSAEMGNSPGELREHYAEIALPIDAKKWFAVAPVKRNPKPSRATAR